MFEENYKKAMDAITPSEQIRSEISEKIKMKEHKHSAKNPAVVWRVAFAAVACAAIVLCALFIPHNTITLKKSDSVKTLSVVNSYNKIYKILSKSNNKYLRSGNEEFDGAVDERYIDSASKPTTGAGSTANTGGSSKNTQESAVDIKNDYSDTTEQVDGVSESDIVKTDGKYIYSITDADLRIFKADGEKSALLSQTKISDDQDYQFGEMFIKNDRLIILKSNYENRYKQSVSFTIYDVSDASAPQKIAECSQDGVYNSARMVDDYVYLISNCYINLDLINKDEPATFVPGVVCNDTLKTVPADRIYCFSEENCENMYTVVGAYNYKDGALSDTASLLGGSESIYCSKDNIILTNSYFVSAEDVKTDKYSQTKTTVSRLEINNGKIKYKASGDIDGELENQFFIDEYNGYFRFVTTVYEVTESVTNFANTTSGIATYSSDTFAKLSVLDGSLKTVGTISDLARGEKVYSVRFMGDIAYFVTFRQTDPLFSADLTDPQNPKILGELKITGFSEYMYPYGDGLLLGFGQEADAKTGITSSLKLSMFNISDPSDVFESDKTVVEGYNYSPALWNHKAMLVSPTKNLIGFASGDNYGHTKYLIYRHTDNAFERAATLEFKDNSNIENVRALFINDAIYIVTPNTLSVYDINTFLQINKIEF